MKVGNTLTVEQQMKTMTKHPTTPPMPTNQVILRKRMTPKMFWMHGMYTPIRVPSWGAWRKTRGGDIIVKSPNKVIYKLYLQNYSNVVISQA